MTMAWISRLVKIARHLVHELAGFLEHVELGLFCVTALIDDVYHTENSANDHHQHERWNIISSMREKPRRLLNSSSVHLVPHHDTH